MQCEEEVDNFLNTYCENAESLTNLSMVVTSLSNQMEETTVPVRAIVFTVYHSYS